METQTIYTDLEKNQPKSWDDVHNEFKKMIQDRGLKDNSENFRVWLEKYFQTPQTR